MIMMTYKVLYDDDDGDLNDAEREGRILQRRAASVIIYSRDG
jgi:hypothetical protein